MTIILEKVMQGLDGSSSGIWIMDHKRRLVFRFDADLHSDVIELRGCLGVPATSLVKRLLLGCRSLKDQPGLTLDSRAGPHFKPPAVTALSLPPVPRTPSGTPPVPAAPPDAFGLSTTSDLVRPPSVLFGPGWSICPVGEASRFSINVVS